MTDDASPASALAVGVLACKLGSLPKLGSLTRLACIFFLPACIAFSFPSRVAAKRSPHTLWRSQMVHVSDASTESGQLARKRPRPNQSDPPPIINVQTRGAGGRHSFSKLVAKQGG